MNASSLSARLIGAAVLTFAASAAHAAFTFTTVSAGGNSATAAQTYAASVSGARDAFSDLTISDVPPPLGISLNRTVYPGPATYTVSTETNLYTVQSPVIGGPALSVDGRNDTLTFNNFGGVGPEGIRSFGASFYLSELTAGNAVIADITVTATGVDNISQTYNFQQGVSSNAPSLYFRLGSTVALQSVVVSAGQGYNVVSGVITPLDTLGNSNLFLTADNVVVGAVPLPAAGWLLISGLGGMGLFKRRRRA